MVDKQEKIALLFGLTMLLLVAACMPLGVPLVLERSPIIRSDAGSMPFVKVTLCIRYLGGSVSISESSRA